MSTLFRKMTLFTISALLVSVSALSASAVETGTIVNASDRNVEFFVKWGSNPNESPLYVLAPGESATFRSGSGDRLGIRYNSTPGMYPARVRGHLVYTADVAPTHPGFQSFFRTVNQSIVTLQDR